jgi:hypothetical protein
MNKNGWLPYHYMSPVGGYRDGIYIIIYTIYRGLQIAQLNIQSITPYPPLPVTPP